MQNELIKQAIADAKALRQSAYELAKEQIAETFGPRVQEMIRLKLSEMDDDETMAEEKDKEEKSVEEAKHDEKAKMEAKHEEEPMKEGDDMGEVDEVSLDELLAELDKEDDKMKSEAEGDDEEKKDDEEEKEEGGEDEAPADDAGDAMPASDEEVTELSVEELKDIIRDVVAEIGRAHV